MTTLHFLAQEIYSLSVIAHKLCFIAKSHGTTSLWICIYFRKTPTLFDIVFLSWISSEKLNVSVQTLKICYRNRKTFEKVNKKRTFDTPLITCDVVVVYNWENIYHNTWLNSLRNNVHWACEWHGALQRANDTVYVYTTGKDRNYGSS